MDFKISFLIPDAQRFYESDARNACISGGFGSTKTYTCLLKVLTLCIAYDKYRVAIGRLLYKDLLATTFKTWTKICPWDLVDKWDEQKGYMRLKNGSEILWMHFDDFNEQAARGLEVNTIYIDQPEEVSEEVYTTMDSRVGRWDKAVPNASIINPASIKKNKFGNWVVPSYMMLSPNPDTETHWIWREYHPDSEERNPEHFYCEVSSLDNPALDPKTLKTMMSHDPSWIKRFVHGKWGISERQIHIINKQSYLNFDPVWLRAAMSRGRLSRVLDHGDASPTAMTWWLSYRPVKSRVDVHICYREYYVAGETISYHRREISALSGQESYALSLADPSIFKQTLQKYGGFWTVADEYSDTTGFEEAPIVLSPADNNELATRNRFNEYLALNDDSCHPITGESPAPQLYFIRKSAEYPNGVVQLTKEIPAQVREKLGEIKGKPIYSDAREKNIVDHSYDTARYLVASHLSGHVKSNVHAPYNSFAGHQRRMKIQKIRAKQLRAIA